MSAKVDETDSGRAVLAVLVLGIAALFYFGGKPSDPTPPPEPGIVLTETGKAAHAAIMNYTMAMMSKYAEASKKLEDKELADLGAAHAWLKEELPPLRQAAFQDVGTLVNNTDNPAKTLKEVSDGFAHAGRSIIKDMP